MVTHGRTGTRLSRYYLYSGDRYIAETDDLEHALKMLVSTQDPDAFVLDFMTGKKYT